MAGWRGKLLCLAARALLTRTCLASIPVYLLSFIKFPKWAIKVELSHEQLFLASWESVVMCKEFGGLDIPNLRDLNICLLASWLKRYDQDRDKLWREPLVINITLAMLTSFNVKL